MKTVTEADLSNVVQTFKKTKTFYEIKTQQERDDTFSPVWLQAIKATKISI